MDESYVLWSPARAFFFVVACFVKSLSSFHSEAGDTPNYLQPCHYREARGRNTASKRMFYLGGEGQFAAPFRATLAKSCKYKTIQNQKSCNLEDIQC